MAKLEILRIKPCKIPNHMNNTSFDCRQAIYEKWGGTWGREAPSACSPNPVSTKGQPCCGWSDTVGKMILIKSQFPSEPTRQFHALSPCRMAEISTASPLSGPATESQEPPPILEHYAFTMPENPTPRQLRRYLRGLSKHSTMAAQIRARLAWLSRRKHSARSSLATASQNLSSAATLPQKNSGPDSAASTVRRPRTAIFDRSKARSARFGDQQQSAKSKG